MAELPLNRFPLKWMSGDSERTAVYAILDVTSGDVMGVHEQFSIVKRAVAIGTTAASAGGNMSISGTTITMPAGASRDAAYMLVFGAAAA